MQKSCVERRRDHLGCDESFGALSGESNTFVRFVLECQRAAHQVRLNNIRLHIKRHALLVTHFARLALACKARKGTRSKQRKVKALRSCICAIEYVKKYPADGNLNTGALLPCRSYQQACPRFVHA
jgi:hypothetical protein